jgi:hypothetical protein
MRRDDDRRTLDPALTALALRGLSKPAAYPFVERHLWRRRAAGVWAAILASVRGRTEARTGMVARTPGPRP